MTFAGRSAYDAFAAAAGVTQLLDEHYRCHPEIVDVPNREVYQGRLTVLTDPARLAAPANPAVRWLDVPGNFSHSATDPGRNDVEIAEVVAKVTRLRAAHPDIRSGWSRRSPPSSEGWPPHCARPVSPTICSA